MASGNGSAHSCSCGVFAFGVDDVLEFVTYLCLQADDLEMQLLQMKQQLARFSLSGCSNSMVHGDHAGWRGFGYGCNDGEPCSSIELPPPVLAYSSSVGKYPFLEDALE